MWNINFDDKFFRGYDPDGNSSNTAQTGDFSIFLLAILMLAVITFVAILYIYIKNIRLTKIPSHVNKQNQRMIQASNLATKSKIDLVILVSIALTSTIFYANKAIAQSITTPLQSDKSIVNAVVSEDGSFTVDTCILTNTDTYKYALANSSIVVAEESKAIVGLEDSLITISGFDGIVFEGNPTNEYSPVGLSYLLPNENTRLSFKITFKDEFSIEQLFDRNVFSISLTPKADLPFHDNLFEYTPKELKTVSEYLSHTNNPADPSYVHFQNFIDNGLAPDGSDNGKPMKNLQGAFNDFAKYHWAIDKNGRLANDANFENDANTTIQVRLIGINSDSKEDGSKNGLTFMTTHALDRNSAFNNNVNATYGWAGQTADGSCSLQSFLSYLTDVPADLSSQVVPVVKSFKYSGSLGSGKAINKFWAPSMYELYGAGTAWPSDSEGVQYSAFEGKASATSFSVFSNIDKKQSGESNGRYNFVWSRSLSAGWPFAASGVFGSQNGLPGLIM